MMRAAYLMTVAAVIASGLMLAGCRPQYVNIPAQRGDVAVGNPNAQAIREMQAQALRAVLRERPLEQPIQIQLPADSDPLTYAAVAEGTEMDVVTPHDEVEPASIIEVRRIRIRAGTNAEVDIIRPRQGGGEQTVTVYMSRPPFASWAVDRLHVWRGDIQR